MTASEMFPAIGQFVLVVCESLNVACQVKDVKMAYGSPRILVEPVAGVGEQWVGLSRIRVLAAPPEGVRRRMQGLLEVRE